MEELLAHPPGTAIHPSQPDDLALLMLTSGSTAAAKLVMLTHRNLISRCLGSAQANGFSSSDVTLNWMPLDHVAGLIYFHLRDVFLKCRQIHAATAFVLEEPLRWLDWMERYRVTITFAPNFAYGLVNARAEEIARRKWDLSSVRYVLNGAEPIAARTARRFLQLLEPHGLPATAMRPAWGMAETSSGVTYSNRFSLATTRDDDRFVEVGAPIPGVALRVVDEQDRGLPEGTVGRLQVKGATVTPGYYAAPELNRTVFTADGWFDT
jgi:acyl-CoA synthetase (AMP-forming)/AMP-acid ligase II